MYKDRFSEPLLVGNPTKIKGCILRNSVVKVNREERSWLESQDWGVRAVYKKEFSSKCVEFTCISLPQPSHIYYRYFEDKEICVCFKPQWYDI